MKIISSSFAIFLLILKPLMLLLLNQVRKDRDADGTAPIFGQWSLHDGHGKIDYSIFLNISFVCLY
jgi:hypothetical protein